MNFRYAQYRGHRKGVSISGIAEAGSNHAVSGLAALPAIGRRFLAVALMSIQICRTFWIAILSDGR